MLTTDNYFDSIKGVNLQNLPADLQDSHEFLVKVTKNGTSWKSYDKSPTIKEAIDLHFQQMQQHLVESKKPAKKQATTSTRTRSVAKKERAVTHQSHTTTEDSGNDPLLVSRVPEELKFIRRFVNLSGKTKTKEDILRFISALQRAIIEKRIRKTSQWAEQITYIQDRLIETYNSMKDKISLFLKPETLEAFRQFIVSEKVLPSVGVIKRYIGIAGKTGMKDKAQVLLTQIDRATEKKRITDSDPYYIELREIKKNLQNFVADKNAKVLDIETTSLSGLQGIVSGLGCACQSLNGTDDLPQVMSSVDFVKLDFPTIGFTGKWRNFIGDPSPGFTAMVFGLPKFGKSTLCIDFAGYLAEQHGSVLYVAKEERLHRTLQDKIKAMQVSHPRLYVASALPDDLSSYQYVFLDSVNLLGLTVDELRKLKSRYPAISFIYVFQSTKAGNFRGENSFQHDVDAVIEVPQWGKARQYGRFNQGGEMDIFESEEWRQAA